MSRCRVTAGGYYTEDGEPCYPRTEHGDPLEHCSARARCSEHVEPGVLSCPRCVGRTRAAIRRIADLTPLLPVASVEAGRIDSEAFNLAGPAADPAGWSAVKVQAIHDGTIDLLPEDDEAHPYAVLGRWDLLIREEYGPATGLRITVGRAADYLDSQLDRLAQDDEQDFPLFVREMSACLARVEAALSVAQRREVGAPCPACAVEGEQAPRLVMHRVTADPSGASDLWRCPVDREHKWTEAEYRKWVSDDYLANSDRLTAPQMQQQYRISPGTLRQWVARGQLKQRGRDHSGRITYDVTQAVALRDKSA